MGLLRRIPTTASEVFPFLPEVDFKTYEMHLAGLSLTRPVSTEEQSAKAHRLPGIQPRLNELRMILVGIGNAWLQGVKGSGKTSVIELLLRARAERTLSSQLLSKPFFLFDANQFFIRTPRQDWVKVFDDCLKSVADRKGIVIFDNADDFIHTASDEAGRLVNTLISHLEHGTGVQAILASRSDRTALINDTSSGIARQFETMVLEKEAGTEELRAMLVGHVARLEDSYRVHYTDEAIDEILRLLNRYPGRAFVAPRPGNAVAFADKVGAYVRLNKYAEPPRVTELRELIGTRRDEITVLESDEGAKAAAKRAQLEAEVATLQGEYEQVEAVYSEKFAPLLKEQASFESVEMRAAQLRNKAERSKEDNEEFNILNAALVKSRGKLDALETQLYPAPPAVTAAHVRQVFNLESGIVIKSEAERVRRLDQLDTYLNNEVYLQDRPKAALSQAYKDRELGVSDPTRPTVFIFVGGTGLGKNELWSALERFDRGVENRPDLAAQAKPITVNLNEYGRKSAVTNLTGSDRGNVGWGEAIGWMSDVRRLRRAQLLFDEGDKAHPAMFKTIMQIAETGELADSTGQVTDFRDTLIGININGLTADDFKPGEMDNEEAIRAKLLQLRTVSDDARESSGEYPKLFTPEFIGRIDGVFVFENLGEPQLVSIFRNKALRRLNQDYNDKGLSIDADDETCRTIIQAFNAKQNGGRGPRQVANKLVRPLISQALMVRKRAAIEAGTFEELPPEKLRLVLQDRKLELRSDAPTLPAPLTAVPPLLAAAS